MACSYILLMVFQSDTNYQCYFRTSLSLKYMCFSNQIQQTACLFEMLMLLLWQLMHLGKVLLKATWGAEFASSSPPVDLQDDKSPRTVEVSVFAKI